MDEKMQGKLNYNVVRQKRDNLAFILFFTLSSFAFFRPLALVGDNNPVLKYIYFAILLILIFYTASRIFKKNNYEFSLSIKLLMISIALSMLSAAIYRSQDVFDSFLAAEYPVMGYVFYFYLIKQKVKIVSLEKVILWVGVLFIIAFLVSFVAYPRHLFEYNESLEDRGFQRILLTGSGFLFLLTFLALNKILIKRSFKWMAILLLCYLCIVLSLTRIYILSTAVISVFYVWKKQQVAIKIALLALLYVGVTVVAQLNVTQQLFQKTQDDTEDIKDYIRYQAAQYYLTDFQPSLITRVIGNGFGYGTKTDYGREIIRLQDQGYYVEDLGIIGLFIYLGIFAVVAYGIIFYKSFKIKVPRNFSYLKMYIFFVFLNGLTNSGTFSEAAVVSIVFALYIFDVVKRTENEMRYEMLNENAVPEETTAIA